MCERETRGCCGVPVAESAVAPPGSIPNPVVTHGSAGEYCRGDAVGGEAAAGAPQDPETLSPHTRRGVEQWQLVGLITQRSEVRILPPLPRDCERSLDTLSTVVLCLTLHPVATVRLFARSRSALRGIHYPGGEVRVCRWKTIHLTGS